MIPFLLGLGVALLFGWMLMCCIVLWMEGWREGSRDLREFHAFMLRPWKYR